MVYVLAVLGGVGTVGGAVALSRALGHSRAGRRTEERRWFTGAVAALVIGSAAFLAAALMA